MTHPRRIWLASASPRRRRLLHDAGIDVTVRPAGVDDSRLDPRDASAACWVMAMAHLKASALHRQLREAGECENALIIGADTVCCRDGEILGQPRSPEHARKMLRSLSDGEHLTFSGVCLLSPPEGGRLILHDSARVRVGRLDDARIETYVDSGEWRGKAGGYNLEERIDAGWPIHCEGDPTTVMGLPMRRLKMILKP